MAIAGLVLGVLSLGVWTIVLAELATGVIVIAQSVAEEQAIAEQFARDLSGGKIDAAMASSVDGIDRAMLAEASEQMKKWGPLERLEQNSIFLKGTRGVRRTTLGGDARFARETRTYSVTLKKVGEGFRVEMFRFE